MKSGFNRDEHQHIVRGVDPIYLLVIAAAQIVDVFLDRLGVGLQCAFPLVFRPPFIQGTVIIHQTDLGIQNEVFVIGKSDEIIQTLCAAVLVVVRALCFVVDLLLKSCGVQYSL